MSVFEMKKLIDEFIKKNPNSTVLNMMFHSMEIIPNASPYVRSKKGQGKFLKKLKSIFEYLKTLGFESKTLTEIYNDKLR